MNKKNVIQKRGQPNLIKKLSQENLKLKEKIAMLEGKITKLNIQIKKASLTLMSQKLSFDKLAVKLRQKIDVLQSENIKLRDPNAFSPVDLSKYRNI